MHDLVPPRPPRSPWQLAYNAAHRLRRSWWARRAQSLPRPVVSVGNLHLGGTGKTPLVAAIARHFRDQGVRVAILTRGYRRQGSGVVLVSTGDGPLVGPSRAGDEPVLLAGELPGVSVIVGESRLDAGRHALERLHPPPDLFLLDDGFSHLRLHRDLDLVALPAADPWGGGRLLPSGRLREPLAAIERADAVLLTGAAEDSEAEAHGTELAEHLQAYDFAGRGFSSRTVAGQPLLAGHRPVPAGATALLVTGIARPERFAATVEALGFRVADHLRFSDHHVYPEASLEKIRRMFHDCGAECVLTTAKDQVKLVGRLSLPVAEVPIEAEPETAFWTWLDSWWSNRPGLGEAA